MNILSTLEYKRAFESYIRRGIPIERSLKMARRQDADAEEHSTTHYVWRTVGDAKVRATHAENEGKIFSWDDPPETGHPGEDYNCRCTAEPYIEGETEFAYQELVGEIPTRLLKWTKYQFAAHFFFGGGNDVYLAYTGNLPGLINFYNYEIVRDGKNSVERLKAQIIDEARKHPSGEFVYMFGNNYDFTKFIEYFGGATVGGQFKGTVRQENGMMFIQGKINFRFQDTFTDLFGERQDAIGTSNPSAATEEMLKQTEYGGDYYDIIGEWQTDFRAEAKYDENSSRYVWD